MKIDELGDFPALQQLAQALWREGTARGAAVLVGAGFSRNASRSGADTPKPPLWSTLMKALARKLYADPKDAPSDPLRLAEEYRTNLGQTALDEFVRTSIHDLAWEPGALHSELLELPWSDVLTTNWDTLLERTKSTKRWQAVRSTADLAHGGERRIVKLHGTAGVSEHFIFAEEDYRTYPTRFAAFVNTARQIFVENELCLIGFSGDDPNFLQWSGWVRDHLGESARRIYLVGALDLKPTRRKFLKSRNIAPIDFGPLVPEGTPDERQTAATAMFLRYLANAKSKARYDWEPAGPSAYAFMPRTQQDIQRSLKDPEYAAPLLDQAAQIWQRDRESYPSWLVCPTTLRHQFYQGTNICRWQQPAALAKLEPKRRAQVIYELVWRLRTSFENFDPRLEDLLASCANPEEPNGLGKPQQIEVALALLRLARCRCHDEAFARWHTQLEANTEVGSDFRAEVVYQRCLRARDRLDLNDLARELRGLEGPDPVWRLRRAALLCELGDFLSAGRLLLDARDELRERQRRDRKSLWVLSRLAWAEWLSGAASQDWVRPGPSLWEAEFKQSHCDPRTEIDAIGEEAMRQLRRAREDDVEAIPLFEPGHYRDPSQSTRIGDGLARPFDKLDRLIETVGLPFRLNHYNMLGQVIDDAADLVYEPTFAWYAWLLRAHDSSHDRQFQRYFGRMPVACLAEDAARRLFDSIIQATAYWRDRTRILGRENST